jgi:hypothetical protein
MGWHVAACVMLVAMFILVDGAGGMQLVVEPAGYKASQWCVIVR